MVISTALFDKPAFKNLIVNGLVLAEDGSKMSKRTQISTESQCRNLNQTPLVPAICFVSVTLCSVRSSIYFFNCVVVLLSRQEELP